ncbi:MAG: aspartate--tRNA ligase [Candidatus Diapherotrites archaeon]|nr:aspartate--tRNA ligase [Candidatus Diapherotrites archaeon]
MKGRVSTSFRSHSCGELNERHVGKDVTLSGWVSHVRDHGELIFIDLRDRYGITQVVFDSKNKEIFEKAKKLRNEFVVQIKGRVKKRPKGTENPKLKTGKIEVHANEINILSKADVLPFELDSRTEVSEELRLKYRYLDLRTQRMQRNLIFKHKFLEATREYFFKNNFIELHTPLLTKSTPEGARDFLVPSRLHPGKFYALPQSPQLFKQIFMVSGFDRYFQIAYCLRDEDLRADRQYEFLQIDLEMSFVDVDDVLKMLDGYIAYVMEKLMGVKIKLPLPRISYEEAMHRFGTDKPDMRFGMELIELTSLVKDFKFEIFDKVIKNGGAVYGLIAENALEKISKKFISKLEEKAKESNAKGLLTLKIGKTLEGVLAKNVAEAKLKTMLKKIKAKKGDILFIVADEKQIAQEALGNIRVMLAKELNIIPKNRWEFVWVVDFPLFEWSDEEQRWKSMHHPFTMPRDEDIPLLEKEPAKVKAKAYDLVLNGEELGGGSIRIHRPELQRKIFSLLKISKQEAEKKFGFLLEAFKYGAPPHGGIALGLDRFVAALLNEETIREVIAFPKNKAGESPMDGAPDYVNEKQLRELHIKLDETARGIKDAKKKTK